MRRGEVGKVGGSKAAEQGKEAERNIWHRVLRLVA